MIKDDLFSIITYSYLRLEIYALMILSFTMLTGDLYMIFVVDESMVRDLPPRELYVTTNLIDLI